MPGTITSDLTAGLINNAETVTGWATIGAWAAAPSASADIYIEGAAGINGRISTTAPPTISLGWDHVVTPANLNLTIDERHLFYWMKCFSLPSMEARVRGGIGISISSDATPTKTGTDPWSGATNSKQWFVTGCDFEPTSGWVCYVVDATSTPDLTIGNPVMSTVNRAGIRAGAIKTVGGGAIKPLPVMWDKIAYGTGLTINDGTPGAPVSFADVYATDSANANCFGVLTQSAGIYYAAGKFRFGTTGQTAPTYFKDTNQVIVFQDFRVAATFYELKLAGNTSPNTTTVQLGEYAGGLTSGGLVIKGSGLTTRRAVAPAIVSGGTGYAAGNILTVSGGTFTAAAQVKVITVSGGVITELRMETAGSYSIPPTGTLSLTGGGGSGATCTLTFVGGSIWTLTADATNQTLKLYGCSFSEMTSAALASTSELRGCTFDNFGNITTNGATIDGCIFQNMRTATPINATYALVVTVAGLITNCRFINCATALLWNVNADTNGRLDGGGFSSGGAGHGIEFGSSTPSSPTELTLTNVIFTGYGGTPGSNMTPDSGSADAAIYNNSGKTLKIKIIGGSVPSVRNGAGVDCKTEIITGQRTFTFTVKNEAGTPLTEYEWRLYLDDPAPGRIGDEIDTGHSEPEHENATQSSYTYTYTFTGNQNVVLQVMHSLYRESVTNDTLKDENREITVILMKEENV